MGKLVKVILSDEELLMTESEWYQVYGKSAEVIEQEIKKGTNDIKASEVKAILEKHPSVLERARERQIKLNF